MILHWNKDDANSKIKNHLKGKEGLTKIHTAFRRSSQFGADIVLKVGGCHPTASFQNLKVENMRY